MLYKIAQKTISAIEKIMSGGSGGYLGLFLRKDIPDFSKGLEKPEIITGASDLYSVGTFAQIQRMTKSVDEHADDDGHMNMAILTGNEPKHDDDTDRSNVSHANLFIMPHRRIDLLGLIVQSLQRLPFGCKHIGNLLLPPLHMLYLCSDH